MNQILPFPIWVGHGGEGHDFARVYDAGIEAVVELSAEEPPFPTPRDLITCRVPLTDGPGNPPERLVLAVRTVATLVASEVPTLVCCGAGMSRAPAVVAAALALAYGGPAADWLGRVTRHNHSDVSPGLWGDLAALSAQAFAPSAPSRARV
jgi:protein-tyrosine phosphatase